MLKQAFPPIIVDGTRERQQVRKAGGVAEALRLNLASEAVDVHFTRCAALREYLMLSMTYSPPPPKIRREHALWMVLLGAVFLTGYGFWKYTMGIDSGRPPTSPAPPVQQAQHPVVDQRPVGPSQGGSRPVLSGMAIDNRADEPPPMPARTPAPEMPKAVPLADLLGPQREGSAGSGAAADPSKREVIRQAQRQLQALGYNPGSVDGDLGPRTIAALFAYQRAHRLPETGRLDEATLSSLALKAPPEQANALLQAFPAGVPPRASASDVHPGDLLLLTGWIHRISRDPDGAYRVQVSPSPRASAPSLSAVVPLPTQTAGTPTMRGQLQTVRSFILGRLLRQQEPSPRGSVLRSPIFVQLTGQLASPEAPPGGGPQRRGWQAASVGWEIRPILDIQFATPPTPSDGPRRR
jgi:peptidoglycan hydrolase-like protein with peptidoglycan-binding domain